MAKRTPRGEAKDDSVTATTPPQARPEKASRRRAPRVTSDTFAARPDAAAERPADAANSEREPEALEGEPSDEDIRLRAYNRYLERGGRHGLEFEDWLEAERELKGQK